MAKTESTIAPEAYKIERSADLATVILTENAVPIDREGQGIYQYDEYRITVTDRPGLTKSVRANFATWLSYAKGGISKSERVKANKSDIVDRLKEAIANNKAYLNLTAPTTAQTTAQVKKLSRQNNLIIRFQLNQFDAAD